MIKVKADSRALNYFHELCRSIKAKTPSTFHAESLSYFWYKEGEYGKSIKLQVVITKRNGTWEIDSYTISIYNAAKVTTIGLYSSKATILKHFRTPKTVPK